MRQREVWFRVMKNGEGRSLWKGSQNSNTRAAETSPQSNETLCSGKQGGAWATVKKVSSCSEYTFSVPSEWPSGEGGTTWADEIGKAPNEKRGLGWMCCHRCAIATRQLEMGKACI